MHPYIIKVLKICLIFCFLFLAGCESRQELEEKYIEKAQILIDQERYEQARLELDLVLRINPENVTSRYLMALIARKKEQYDSAQSLLRKVIYIQPGFLDAQTLLGQLYLDWDEDPNLAMAQANLVLERDRQNIKAMNLKANALMMKGEKTAAEQVVNSILSHDPYNLPANILLAQIYRSDRTFEKAISLLDSILDKYPDEIDVYLLKINYLADAKKFVQAENVFEILLRKFPDELELYSDFIEFYVQSGELVKAEDIHRQLIAQVPERTQPKLELVSFLLAHDNETLAEQELKIYIKNEPENYRFQFLLVSVNKDKPEQMVKLLTNIAEKNKYGANGLKARNLLARQALKQGENDRARQLVEKVLENDPINTEALLIRSGLLLDEGNYSAAIRDLRTLLRDSPDSEEALMLLADAHTNTQHLDLAKEIYSKVLKINPDNTLANKKMEDLMDKY